jgi:hypothetical protein
MSINETLAQRSNTHGSFKDNSEVSQSLKSVIRNHPHYAALSADKKEAIDMICHKLARIMAGNPEHADHWHDVAGYATLVDNDLLDRLL